jgi:PAS domain S-box-containing protein
MKDERKTKKQLVKELTDLRQRLVMLEENPPLKSHRAAGLPGGIDTYYALLEKAPLGAVLIKKDGTYLYINPQFKKIFGYSLEDIPTGRDWFEKAYPDPEYRKKAIASWKHFLQSKGAGILYPVILEVRCKDGSKKWIHFFRRVLIAEDSLVVFCDDVTARHRVEEALRLSEEKYSKAFRASPLWVAITDLETGTYREVNETFTKITGYHREEVIGKTALEIKLWPNPDDRSVYIDRLKRQGFLRNEEVVFRTKSGELRTHLWFAELIEFDGRIHILSTLLDVHKQKKMEASIQEKEERYRNILQSIQAAVVVYGADARVLAANAKAMELLGLTESRLADRSTLPKGWRFVDEAGRTLPVLDFPVNQVIARKQPVRNKTIGIRRPDLEDLIWVTVSSDPVFNREGAISRVIDTFMDITQIKRTEEALRVSQQKYQRIVETANEGIWVRDTKARTIFANKVLAEMLGCRPEEMLGRLVSDFIFKADLPSYRRRMEARRQGENDIYERRFRRKDGTGCWCQVSASPLKDDRGRYAGAFAMLTNITLRKETEEALKRSEEKFRFLSGQLIQAQENERKRIAVELHDEVGQSLIGLKFQLVNFDKKLRADQNPLKNEIIRISKYIDEMTGSVRRLSRDLRPAVLEHLGLKEALQWLFEDFSKKFNIPIHYDTVIPNYSFPREREITIFRIFQEALANIGKHGRATRISIALDQNGEEGVFSIKDNGTGFSLRNIRRRPPDETGLGLTAMQERAEFAGGLFEIRSQVKKGTRITFRIPFK